MSEMPDLARVAELVAERFDRLSGQLRLAARHLLDHPEDVALGSMRELANQAGLPPVTFVRLARALGFADFSELRQLFQNQLRDGGDGRGFSGKARALQRRGHDDGGATELLKDLFAAEIDNLELTFGKNHPEIVESALTLVDQARRVCVLGQRSCYAPAYFFNYVYRLFRTNSVLLQDQGGTVADELRAIGAGDLLLVITVAPYTTSVVRAVRYAKEQGVKVLAITDDPLGPVGRAADAALLVTAATPSFFHSVVPVMALVQALLALLVARGDRDALAAIETSERQLARFDAYWPEDERGRKPR
jgi:DNA-binding MurR/RpiR family transcriptional regulator